MDSAWPVAATFRLRWRAKGQGVFVRVRGRSLKACGYGNWLKGKRMVHGHFFVSVAKIPCAV